MIKKILRKTFWFVHWVLLGAVLGNVIRGNHNIINNIAIILYIIEIVLIIKWIKEYDVIFKDFKEVFRELKHIHKLRYGLYFSGDKEQLERYTEFIEESSNALFRTCKYLYNDRRATKKQKEEILDIIEQTKLLRANIQPPV